MARLAGGREFRGASLPGEQVLKQRHMPVPSQASDYKSQQAVEGQLTRRRSLLPPVEEIIEGAQQAAK